MESKDGEVGIRLDASLQERIGAYAARESMTPRARWGRRRRDSLERFAAKRRSSSSRPSWADAAPSRSSRPRRRWTGRSMRSNRRR